MISGMVCDYNPIFWILKQTVTFFYFIMFLLCKEYASYGIFILCVMSMVTTIVVGANLGMHDIVSPMAFFCGG
jgi:hypothetical protein